MRFPDLPQAKEHLDREGTDIGVGGREAEATDGHRGRYKRGAFGGCLLRSRGSFHDMRQRDLLDPLLVASDSAPAVERAVEACFPHSARKRCLAYNTTDLRNKVAEDTSQEFKAGA